MFRDIVKRSSVPAESQFVGVPVAIEQFAGKDFFENAAGWSKNDLSALVAATSKAEFDMLVERLKVTDPQFNVKDDAKVSDAIMAIKPRWCQSPNEIMSYAEGLAMMDDSYRKALEDVDLSSKSEEIEVVESQEAKTE